MAKYLLLAVILVVGCSHLKPYHKQPIRVDLTPVKSISFSGKGAGAGVALMAVMGPVGIAIGSAIDVGIGKEINQTLEQGNYDLLQAVKVHAQNQGLLLKNGANAILIIHDIGFRLVPGNEDSIKAIAKVDWINGKKSLPLSIEYQLDNPVSLATIKTDADYSKQLLDGVLNTLFAQVAIAMETVK